MFRLFRLFLTLLLLFCPVLVFAQQNERDMEKEKTYWQQLEKLAPKSVATFKAATEAMDKEDYKTAAQLYELVLKQAPGFDVVYRRLGLSLTRIGRSSDGRALIETAIEKNPSPENLISLAQVLSFPGQGLSPSFEDKQKALQLAKQALAAYRGNDPSYAMIVAQTALDLENIFEFREAVKDLQAKHPNEMQTHYYSAILAAYNNDWTVAEKEIKLAQSLGLPPEDAKVFLDSKPITPTTIWTYLYLALGLSALWMVGLGLLFVFGKLMSNRTLNSIETADPNVATSSQELSLRSLYRKLINVAGFYYYISLPFVVFLVLALTGSILYAFLMIGRIPIKIALILLIGAAITIYKMIRSLFVKIQSEDPGRSLKPEEAPALWALTREVAEVVQTRPIDEIRVTPGCDLAVYERGSSREKAQDRAKRILILGVGVLNDMRLNAFRAVLAHEYGHFSHRDTAGGDVALRVGGDMHKFAVAMVMSGQAVWWNIAFQFLRVYDFIFRRLSHGATRLQEVMADRVAVRNYGADAFEEGLRHAIRRDIEFDHVASKEIRQAMQTNRQLANLYHLPGVKGTEEERQIEESFKEAISRLTSEDDTHPSPIERFRLAARIRCERQLPEDGMVWDLFLDREALTAEMSEYIAQQVKAAEAQP
ncbi:MAG TPA: M48 family metalloprotease [Blastocatellia bacterium]|nr:M48 family metalloprotease [Blastocatellia bacterium]